MSVLKNKRTTSKAEFVNTANLIYVGTISILSRLSARYSRLLAPATAAMASEVLDHAEKGNKIFPAIRSARNCAGSICWRPWPPFPPWTCN